MNLLGKLSPHTVAPGRSYDTLVDGFFGDDGPQSIAEVDAHLFALEAEVDDLEFEGRDAQDAKQRLAEARRRFSGQAVFSLLLPADLCLEFGRDAPSIISSSPHPIKIERGQLSGVLTQASLLVLVNVIVCVYGTQAGSNFMFNVQTLANEFLSVHGSTVSLSDFRVHCPEAKELSARASAWVDQQGEVDPKSPMELKVQSVLEEARTRAGKIAMLALASRSGRNGALEIVKSGTKGDVTTIIECCVMVGQQFLDAERLHTPLPLYAPEELHKQRAQKAGYVCSNLCDGLEPEEMFMIGVPVRSGQVSTANNLAVIGYFQPRLCKGTEGLYVAEDRTVRTPAGKLASISYGGDCFDPRWVKTYALAPAVATRTGTAG